MAWNRLKTLNFTDIFFILEVIKVCFVTSEQCVPVFLPDFTVSDLVHHPHAPPCRKSVHSTTLRAPL